MRCILALLFGTALVCAADPQFPAAAFYWGPTQVAIVLGEASDQVLQNATKMPDRNLWPPFGQMFALPEVSNSSGVKIGDSFDTNLTGNFWVRATVSNFTYNKTEYTKWIVAIASVDPDNQGGYAAALRAKLHVFLAEPAKLRRIADTGKIRSPVVKIDLSASERAALESNLNEIQITKLHQGIRKEQSATPDNLQSALLSKAKLILNVEQVDLGQPFEVRQHVLGTWMIGNKTVFSIQGWKRPGPDRIESVEAIDGLPVDKGAITGAFDDWGEESLDDFTIENVFPGGRLVRHSSGYESSTIYLERMTAKGREFERSLYGI